MSTHSVVSTVVGLPLAVGFLGGLTCGAVTAALTVLQWQPAQTYFAAATAFFAVLFVTSFVLIQFLDFDSLPKND